MLLKLVCEVTNIRLQPTPRLSQYIMNSIDPQKSKRDEAKLKSKKVLGRLGIQDLDLTEHESVIAAEVISPHDISVNFEGNLRKYLHCLPLLW